MAIELTYRYPLTENTFIQLGFQHIINPCETGTNPNKSFTARIRFGMSL